MLPTADAVEDVMLRGRTLDALRTNATWAQMGTIGVQATERLAAEVARRRPDVAFVDAPVSGSREPARNGRLLILASGPDRAHRSVDAVFAALGQRTLWLGPAGTASRLKLVLNAWLAFEIEAAAEVDALAERLGVSFAVLSAAVAGGPLASTTALAKLVKMESGDRLWRGDDAGGQGHRGALATARSGGPRTLRHQRRPAGTGCRSANECPERERQGAAGGERALTTMPGRCSRGCGDAGRRSRAPCRRPSPPRWWRGRPAARGAWRRTAGCSRGGCCVDPPSSAPAAR